MSFSTIPLRQRIFVAVIIYILWVIGFAYYSFNQEKNRLYTFLDTQLETAALTATLLLPDDLHHQNIHINDVSPQIDSQNILTLSGYTDQTEIVYIYTLVLRGDKIFFTSSSATEEERRLGEGFSNYFDYYDDVDPRVFEIFKTKQKTFLEYSDQWGGFRSVFIPTVSKDGTFYLAVADLSTNDIQLLLNQYLYQTIILALLFLVFSYPIYRVATDYIKQKSQDLEQQLQQKTRALSTNQLKLERALQSANQSWFEMDLQSGTITTSAEYITLLEIEDKLGVLTSTFENWQKNIHPDDYAATMQQFYQAIQSDKTITIEFRRRTEKGNWLWIHSSGQVIERDNDGDALIVAGINMDITARKRSELVLQALAETGTTTDNDIFKTIVRQLALSHDMRYAFIATVDANITESTTLALWADGQFIDNMTYKLKDTPCFNVVTQQGAAFYPDDIQQLFPDDQMLVDMQARSYLGVPLRNENNEVLGLISVLDSRSMAENKQTEALLNSLSMRATIELGRRKDEKRLQLFAHIFHDSHEGILLIDHNNKIIEANPAVHALTGYTTDELIGKDTTLLNSDRYPAEFYQTMRQQLEEQGVWQGELWNRAKNGEDFASAITISLLNDDDSDLHRIILATDITEKKQQQDALQFMAHYDALTQLPNRTLFVDRFNQAVAHSKRNDTLLAVCFLDLDNFKPINDNHGHEVGDQLLIEVSQRITDNLREEDTVSRQGGDEFTLLLGSIESFEQCQQMLTRLLHSIAKPYYINDSTHDISASIGVTLYPLDEGDIDTLTRHADQAMYQAKQSGKNQYHFFNALDIKHKKQQQQQQQALRHALQYNQFCLHYQPKVNMKSGKVSGVEALIRWQHPEQGMLFPLDFLPAAENTILENDIGDWVIEQALSQMTKWHQQNIELEVSVNISSNHLQSPSFISKLEERLAAHPELNPSLLQLEILESSALGDIHTISNIIKTCQDTLGISIALDDFGTGYSSLTHLRNLSAQTIKIDRSFVRDLLDDPDDFAIIDGVIGLAQAFNRNVIAEGVETTNHGLMLLAMGCNEAQGYGISRPIPANDLAMWLENYSPNQRWLNCGKKSHSEQQIKVKFIRLTTEKWRNTIEETINSSNPIKPERKVSLCHLGVWIDQLKKDSLFSENWLDSLDQTHNDLFTLGEAVIHLYINDRQSDAINKLQQLDHLYEQLVDQLDHYE